ncbi:MAG: pantoate--beta-alanine ligase [Acidobacteriota bacterium]|nr:pantoate--beta-alanine ligase [Acidobacteriota bacterium]
MSIRLQSQTDRLRAVLSELRVAGRTIGFVPTMGYLHYGHRSLIERSRDDGCFTVVSVFVNPAQFGPDEDLDTYPADHDRDFELSVASGADLVWYPERTDLYPPESQTMVKPGALADRLCGVSRPQFFPGICSVVLRFFNLIKPDRAYFGEKDFQQLAIIKRMAADFYLDVDVIGCPLQREADGLAMSSRNARLAPEDRDLALTLYRTITEARTAYAKGERDAEALRTKLKEGWPQGIELDYLDFREPVLLEEVATLAADTRIFLGAWLNGVRLIDNDALT